MKHPRLTLSISAIALVGIIALVSILTSSSKVNWSISNELASGLRYPQIHDKNHVDYFTGTTFRRISITDQTSSALTPEYALPNVTDVRWGSDGALFRASGYSGGDQLRSTLVRAALPTSNPYWWYADYATGAISLVGDVVAARDAGALVDDVNWSTDGKTYYFLQTPTYADSDNSTKLYSVKPGSTPTLIGSTEATRILWINADKMIIQTNRPQSHKIEELALTTKAVRPITSEFNGIASVAPSGNYVLAVNTGKTSDEEGVSSDGGKLMMIAASDGKIREIDKNFLGSIAWSANQDAWVAVKQTLSDGAVNGYTGDNDKNRATAFSAKVNRGQTLADTISISFLDGRTILSQGDNKTRIMGADELSLKPVNEVNAIGGLTVMGTERLISGGLSTAQISALKQAFRNYLISTKASPDAIITLSEIVKIPHDYSTPNVNNFVTFNAQVNDTQLVARLRYFSLSSVQLQLTAPGGSAPVYDSGVINTSGF